MPGFEDPMSAINPPTPEAPDGSPKFDEVAEAKMRRAIGVSENGDREGLDGIKLTGNERAEVDKRLDEHQAGIDKAVGATLAFEAAELRGEQAAQWSQSVDELSDALSSLTDHEKEIVKQRAQAERGQSREKE